MLDSFEEANEILQYVLDEGINLIDTARAYNGEDCIEWRKYMPWCEYKLNIPFLMDYQCTFPFY